MELLVGTYTRGSSSQGIYRCDFDVDTGVVSEPALLIETDNPSWLGRWQGGLIAVNEHGDVVGEGQGEGEVSVFEWRGNGLAEVQRVPSGGADPCHLALQNDRLAVANYSGGTVALFAWSAGRVGNRITLFKPQKTGPHPRQASAHPHGVYFQAGELRVPDLGGDCIHRLDPTDGTLLGHIEVPAGAGPRHLTPNGGYLVNELDNTVIALEADGSSSAISTLPVEFEGRSSTAEIQARGQLLYVSNRGHDSIAVLSTRPALAAVQHHPSGGGHPRHFLITPDGRYLLAANRDSDNLVSMRIEVDGTLGETVSVVACPAPVHLLF